jgi:ribulose-bisphosphate carboxylase large chain
MTSNTRELASEITEGFSCELFPISPRQNTENKSAIYRFQENFTWEGVDSSVYKPEGSDFAHIIRNVIIGDNGESCLFHLRYFEVAPGGYSSFEQHQHEHVVICLRGKGSAIVGENIHELKVFDTLYIAPHEPHQLINTSDSPFGFFCIVNSERDRPISLKKREIK